MSLIEALTKTFPSSQVLFPETAEFEAQNSSFLAAQQSDLKPAAIVQPKNKEEVAKFVQQFKPFDKDNACVFAIRGGGQNSLLGCTNVDGPGVTLDLALLNDVEIKDGSVSVGAGARWGDVFDALEGTGQGVSGNRSSKAGIGGLALQGGLSFFSSREGFVSDNVLNYEIVLASGEIVNANAGSNSDLWIALRGGGNNFGIVTRFDFRTFPQGRFWGGSIYYFAPSFPSQIEALVTELQKPDATEDTHLMISVGFAAQFGPQAMCMNQLYYTKEVEKPAVLEPFVSVQPQIDAMNTMRMMTLKEAASEQASDARQTKRCSYMNATVKADAATLIAAHEFYTAAVGQISAEGLLCSFTLQPYALSCLKSSASQGGNPLGLDVSLGPLVSILLLSYWDNREDDRKIEETMRGVLEKIQEDSANRGTLIPYTFFNYASPWQDPIGSYGAENKKMLQEVSKKYDPEGFFQHSVPGGFKLFA